MLCTKNKDIIWQGNNRYSIERDIQLLSKIKSNHSVVKNDGRYNDNFVLPQQNLTKIVKDKILNLKVMHKNYASDVIVSKLDKSVI